MIDCPDHLRQLSNFEVGLFFEELRKQSFGAAHPAYDLRGSRLCRDEVRILLLHLLIA
jgi:hypothetical protein